MNDDNVNEERKHRPVASYRHSLVFLAIVVGVMFAGFAAQKREVAGSGLVESHSHVIPVYLSVTGMNWLLVYFAWRGIRARGGSFGSIIGGRWGSARDVLRDLDLKWINLVSVNETWSAFALRPYREGEKKQSFR